MIVVFGDEPPVFSRPTVSASYPPYQATGPPNTYQVSGFFGGILRPHICMYRFPTKTGIWAFVSSYMPGMPSGISAYPSGYPPNPSGYTGCPYPPGGQYPATTSSQYPSQPPVTTVGEYPSKLCFYSEGNSVSCCEKCISLFFLLISLTCNVV
nr:tumor susceptibility gene 101 protein-like isoform X1 [Odocoileus virginianus texanus]